MPFLYCVSRLPWGHSSGQATRTWLFKIRAVVPNASRVGHRGQDRPPRVTPWQTKRSLGPLGKVGDKGPQVGSKTWNLGYRNLPTKHEAAKFKTLYPLPFP